MITLSPLDIQLLKVVAKKNGCLRLSCQDCLLYNICWHFDDALLKLDMITVYELGAITAEQSAKNLLKIYVNK